MAQNLMDNRFTTEWLQLRGVLRDKWRNLSEEDINQINGSYDRLVSKLQERYGYTRDQAEEHIQNWISDKSARMSGQPRPAEKLARSETSFERKSDGSSFWKWVFGIGIPLILIGTYFNMNRSEISNPSAPASATSMMMTDQLLVDNVRSTFLANSTLAPDIDAIRITSQNGVVTLSGTVPSAEERDLMVTTAGNVRGVTRVIDQLTIR